MLIYISQSLQVNEAQKGVSITWTGRGLKKALESEFEKVICQTTSETLTKQKQSSIMFSNLSALRWKLATMVAAWVPVVQDAG